MLATLWWVAPPPVARVLFAQDRWAQADSATRRLPPSAFSQLPPALRASLERRECTIPQVYDEDTPHNVIQGHFRRAHEMDVAVLCSRKQRSSILVFWVGSPDSVAEIDAADDRNSLQVVEVGRIGFSRRIVAIAPDHPYLTRALARDRGRLGHDAIVDAFEGKGSNVRYFDNERWLKFPGAD